MLRIPCPGERRERDQFPFHFWMLRPTSLRVLFPVLLGCVVTCLTPARCAGVVFDGYWRPLSVNAGWPSASRDAGAIYDSKRDRVLALGADSRVYVLTLGGTTAWTMLATPSVPLMGTSQAVYDVVNDRMVVVDAQSSVFTLSLADPTEWVPLAVTNLAPPGRSFFTVSYDALRNRLLLFGGGPYTGIFNDLWVLNLTGTPQWTQPTTFGVPPPARWGPMSVYDPLRDRLVVGLGVTTINYDVAGDVWTLDLGGPSVWTPLVPGGTTIPGRMLSSAIYDPSSDALLLFSGYPYMGSELWALSFGATPEWNLLHPAGVAPPQRWSANLIYRSALPQMIMLGGTAGGSYLNDSWALDRSPSSATPILASFGPPGGKVGDPVSLIGAYLGDVSLVEFNGVPAPIHSESFSRIDTEVPAGTTSGPIRVTNASGSALSAASFFVGETPVVSELVPDSGRVGSTLELHGRHFSATTKVRLGGTGSAPFTLISDTLMTVVVDTLASTGPVAVTTLAASGTSSFVFTLITDDPRPHLLGVHDVRADQGGRVMLTWIASDFDQARYSVITGYRVWRRAPAAVPALPGRALAAGLMALRTPGGPASDPVVFWESLAELPASFLKGYAYTASTLQDSTTAGNPWTAYFVQAITKNPFVFYNSSADSGYSVDNLAPLTPMPFTVVYASSANTLHWRGRAAADLQGYEIHRGASAEFVPASSNLVATTAETSYVDIPGEYSYKIAARDIHGNLSHFASASPDHPVAVLASFVNVDRSAGRLVIRWFSGGNPGLVANVYRRTAGTEWQLLAAISADGLGYLVFDDPDVSDLERYGYRLGVVEPDTTETMMGETWIDPVVRSFAFIGVASNPSPGGRISLSIAVPNAASATIQLFDIAGREVDRQTVTGAMGASTVEFGGRSRLRAGVYLVRATSAGSAITRRVVVLD